MDSIIMTDLQWIQYSEQPQEDGCAWIERKHSNEPCTTYQWLKDHSCLHSKSDVVMNHQNPIIVNKDMIW